MSIEISRTRLIHSGWVKLLAATLRRGDGSEFEREIVEHGRAVAVLPYDPERRTALLVRLPRAPALHAGGEAMLLEAPAGMMDEDDPEETARREALEEAGVRLGQLEQIAVAWTSPGIMTEQVQLFLAPYSADARIEAGGGVAEENEDIEVVETPLDELWSLVETLRLNDLKTLALVLALRHRRPGLFQRP